jgi:hypothetical protein
VNGETVFAGGLQTAVNEYTEVCSMVLAPSKAHNQYIPAIAAVSNSLETYGHSPMDIVFTDNVRGDKAELDAAIPALRRDVVPVPDMSSLKALTLPSDWTIMVLSSTYQVNTRLNSIMDDLPNGDDFFVAMGMEWSVDRINGIQGRVALISFTFGSEIFLLLVQFFHIFPSSHPLIKSSSYTPIGMMGIFLRAFYPSSEHLASEKLESKYQVI